MPLDRLARSVAANNHGTQLPNTSAIVAIARDTALLRSLAFALEAHGYHVKTFPSWKSAKASMGEALCVIVDGGLPPDDRRAWHESLHAGNNVVLLQGETGIESLPISRVLEQVLNLRNGKRFEPDCSRPFRWRASEPPAEFETSDQ